MITAKEIDSRMFEQAKPGYKPEEVDEFLKEISASFKELQAQLAEKDKKMAFLVETVKKYDTHEFDVATGETKTEEGIDDVGALRSEIGILFLSSFNRRLLMKLFAERGLEFTPLMDCRAYAYLWGEHPLAHEKSVGMEQLLEYPCLSFEQGSGSSLFLAEEILADYDYPRTIKVNDRATMLNLMVGLNGYTLCSGIICEELNGSGYSVVPLEGCGDAEAVMEVGYITKKHSVLSDIGQTYLAEVKRYLGLN